METNDKYEERRTMCGITLEVRKEPETGQYIISLPGIPENKTQIRVPTTHVDLVKSVFNYALDKARDGYFPNEIISLVRGFISNILGSHAIMKQEE